MAVQDDKPKMYLMPFIWPVDSADVSRETTFFNDEDNFPYWKYGNTFTDVDPGFEDARIYEHSDLFVEWTKPASMLHAMGYPADEDPPTGEWTQYHWIPDDDVSVNETWPVFNGKYTNTEMLTASIEGLPLGDLNWFPELKALWEERRDDIDDHMRAANEERIIITSADRTPEKLMPSISIYPNPARDYVRLSERVDRVSIYNVTGSLVKSIQMVEQVDVSEFPIGIYFFKLQNGMNVSTHKVIVAK